MANNASRVARTLEKEDGLYLVLKKLVTQRWRCGGLAVGLLQRHGPRQEQTRPDHHVRRSSLHSIHSYLPQNFLIEKQNSMLVRALVKLPLQYCRCSMR